MGLGGEHQPTLRSRFDLGKSLVNKKTGPIELLDIGRTISERLKRLVKNKILTPQKSQHTTIPKTMESETGNNAVEQIIGILSKNPAIKRIFPDMEALENFLDSLNEQEIRIIIDTQDPQSIIKIKGDVESDLEDTAKQLCMDD